MKWKKLVLNWYYSSDLVLVWNIKTWNFTSTNTWSQRILFLTFLAERIECYCLTVCVVKNSDKNINGFFFVENCQRKWNFENFRTRHENKSSNNYLITVDEWMIIKSTLQTNHIDDIMMCGWTLTTAYFHTSLNPNYAAIKCIKFHLSWNFQQTIFIK